MPARKEPVPEMRFDVPIRTCSKSRNEDGYSSKEWRPGQYVRFAIYKSGADADFDDTTGACFTGARVNYRNGILMGTIVMTLEQFDVPTLAHECLHAVLQWSAEYRPKKISALCGEEMMTYALANLISDAMANFERYGIAISAE